MNSTESRCIHSFQSSLVLMVEVSHACLRCCWFTTILVASAGAVNSVAFALSPELQT